MPTTGIDDYNFRRERIARVEAKLKKLGIDPRSNKYQTLWFRWLNRR